MHDKHSHIIEKFPKKSHEIARLLEKDPEFFALSEDYDVCIEALQYWEQIKEPEAKTRVNEYRTLLRELEEEIFQILAALELQRLD